MHLVMFDIDGTLTETMTVDEECFVHSFRDVFGFANIDTDWSHYPRATDSGIFEDVFTSRIGRSPTAQDVSRFRQHFIQLLAAASSQCPFVPVAGADAESSQRPILPAEAPSQPRLRISWRVTALTDWPRPVAVVV